MDIVNILLCLLACIKGLYHKMQVKNIIARISMNLINISITITASQDDQLELGRIRDRLRVAEAEVGRLRKKLTAKDGKSHKEIKDTKVRNIVLITSIQ